MSIFFPRPNSIPTLPSPIQGNPGLLSTQELTPDFLFSLPKKQGGTHFSSRDKLHILVTEPADVYQLLVSDAGSYLKGDEEVALSKAIGWGLIGLEGKVHKKAQKAAAPALNPLALGEYIQTIKTVSATHFSHIKNGGKAPLRETLRKLAQEAAEKSLFANSNNDLDFAYQENVFNLNAVLFGGEAVGSDAELAIRLAKDYEKSRRAVAQHVSLLIKNWERGGRNRTFLIDYIFGDGELKSDGFDDFHQHVSVFLQAATETTAALASWTIMLLSENKGYWSKLKVELEEAGPVDTYEKISRLEWLGAVIDESLRLFPPAWVIPRVAKTETIIGNTKILPGTRVISSPYVSHRLSSSFPNAEDFHPERWLGGLESLPRGAYFPFGMGNRICIGERYGKLTAKIMLLTALESNLGLNSDHKSLSIDNHSLLLNPSPGINIEAFTIRLS